MITRLAIWLTLLAPTLLASGCFARVSLPIEPGAAEGQFVRACELLDEAARLRPQPATIAALAAIRPPGRFCFVCRRLRRCQARLERLGLESDPQAEGLARQVADRAGQNPTADFPPAGGPSLEQMRSLMCRACASMPPRIQDGAWEVPDGN